MQFDIQTKIWNTYLIRHRSTQPPTEPLHTFNPYSRLPNSRTTADDRNSPKRWKTTSKCTVLYFISKTPISSFVISKTLLVSFKILWRCRIRLWRCRKKPSALWCKPAQACAGAQFHGLNGYSKLFTHQPS